MMERTVITMTEKKSEKKELCRGVFWVNDDDILSVKYPCTSDGDLICADAQTAEKTDLKLINHKKLWKEFPHYITAGLPFNYLPRGRVEVRRGGKAIIFCSPHICTDETKQLVIQQFGLTAENGITKVSLKADGSAHYRCALDDKFIPGQE
ncbi:MAG: hypothetical protein II574_00130 [Ruminococcus sp.]|nr:hypothetical protein [Ruminococcus sp.]